MKSYTVYIEQDEDGVYVGSVPSLPGCYTEGDTLEELRQNLTEAVALCARNTTEDTPKFIGVQNIEVMV